MSVVASMPMRLASSIDNELGRLQSSSCRLTHPFILSESSAEFEFCDRGGGIVHVQQETLYWLPLLPETPTCVQERGFRSNRLCESCAIVPRFLPKCYQCSF